jgi:hypothetical protein
MKTAAIVASFAEQVLWKSVTIFQYAKRGDTLLPPPALRG